MKKQRMYWILELLVVRSVKGEVVWRLFLRPQALVEVSLAPLSQE